ncbi:hypothetical protein [Mesorhizobium sp. M1B.F.Ca.ET.045.04.1.1]|uniref:hypothetical protein n=1 Tax=Mesorhizobium sp. M1B.F.Ca.ET.045.04.1.1 TaxID=2493673 RepID=UPI000F7634CA|nr:hypothetical protein [Mesorhizobium sp. M1B.F.Ca.ET.045.04.1.1]AZO29392.1 hypothetical protein EJ071_19695 [Mesorhizobium sp. M1B.F.Ca.ET.045.04.1.1]
MIETYYLACEYHRPYKVFLDLKSAKDEVQPFIDQGLNFQVAEVEVKAFHEGQAWKRDVA